MKSIDFWFWVAGTYSTLTDMLVMNNIPFAKKPVENTYLWRDLERRHWADTPRVPG